MPYLPCGPIPAFKGEISRFRNDSLNILLIEPARASPCSTRLCCCPGAWALHAGSQRLKPLITRNIIKITKPHVQGSRTFFTFTTSKLRMKSMGLFSAGSWRQLWDGWHCLAHTNSATAFHIAITSPELCAGSATLATQHVFKKSHCGAKNYSVHTKAQRRRSV